MAETQSAPSLRELSEAAAKGRLGLEPFDVDAWGVPMIAIPDETLAGGTLAGGLVAVAMLLSDEYPIDHHDAHPDRAKANAAYLAGLWNAHRAGRLIDPTTLTEAVAAARAEGVREGLERAADWLAPNGPRPCDCERCDCGNVGDLADVAAWDADKAASQHVRALISASPAPARAEGWQPIETAPRDGRWVLLYARDRFAGEDEAKGKPVEERVRSAYFDTTIQRWSHPFSTHFPPTHWQPLPAPPTTPGGRTNGGGAETP